MNWPFANLWLHATRSEIARWTDREFEINGSAKRFFNEFLRNKRPIEIKLQGASAVLTSLTSKIFSPQKSLKMAFHGDWKLKRAEINATDLSKIFEYLTYLESTKLLHFCLHLSKCHQMTMDLKGHYWKKERENWCFV